MSAATPSVAAGDTALDDALQVGGGGVRRRRALWAAAGVAVVLLAGGGATVALAHPFGGGGGGQEGGAALDNGAATALATVAQRSLSSQTSVGGTLGYGGAANVVAPSGTPQQAITQAQQQVAAAQAALAADRTAAADSAAASNQALAQDQAAVDAAPDDAHRSQAQNALAGAQLQARQSADQNSARIRADETTLQNAEAALSTALATAVNPGTLFTALPAVGQTVSRGQPLYAVSGVAVPLFYGTVTPWRSLALGAADGPDVGQLTANLIALGFGGGLAQSNHFSAATQAAVERWQASIGAAQTGVVRLGDIVVEPGAVIVTAVTPAAGGAVQPGATIMQVTSTNRQVIVNLNAAQQSQVKVGDAVTITLPDNRTTPGTVSSVGTVATTPSGSGGGGGGGGGNSTPTVEVDITLTDPSAAGSLDQAPVEVSITTATVDNAMVVPVTALLALAGGGYAVEVVDAHGGHQLVAVTPGLFDDAGGLVQVTGNGLNAGDRVVVPAT